MTCIAELDDSEFFFFFLSDFFFFKFCHFPSVWVVLDGVYSRYGFDLKAECVNID